jgi:hypothetical protein
VGPPGRFGARGTGSVRALGTARRGPAGLLDAAGRPLANREAWLIEDNGNGELGLRHGVFTDGRRGGGRWITVIDRVAR